jgi:hypothetical protein
MWMGGTVPLGYDVKGRKLIVNPAEAETVRLIYRRYLELGCVRKPARQIEETIANATVDLLDDRGELIRVMSEAASDADRLSTIFDASAKLRERLVSEVERGDALRALVSRVKLEREQLRMTILLAPLLGTTAVNANDLEIERAVPLQVRRRGVEMRLLIGAREAHATPPDPILIKELARASMLRFSSGRQREKSCDPRNTRGCERPLHQQPAPAGVPRPRNRRNDCRRATAAGTDGSQAHPTRGVADRLAEPEASARHSVGSFTERPIHLPIVTNGIVRR